ncbi:MAG TPA: hypothetical protein VL172_03270, partial [Kofleriaceae bacterium]|nr:hypothetical protein [Kofleriaceae bacterium]
MLTRVGIAAILVLGCGHGAGGVDPDHGAGKPPPVACTPDAAAAARSDELRGQGRLLEALDAAEAAERACPSADGKRRVARLLEDGWSFERAAGAWKAYAPTGAQARVEAAGALARLSRRPALHQPNTVELERARVLIRAGRLLGDPSTREYARALDKLHESYALWPHPTCLVEMARVQANASQAVESELSLAR